MSVITVNGGKRLNGKIRIEGAKNSVLPILASTLLCRNKCIIHNCPDISDVDAALKILEKLGCTFVRDADTVIVDATYAANYEIPDYLMREMRSSVVFLGAIIARFGRAVITSPGGCELGPRPIDLHIAALKKLGVRVNDNDGFIRCFAEKIVGDEIFLPFPSVGATENIIIAAATGEGTTVINNAAKEPEIVDLVNFLNNSGANISGQGTSTVIINGVKSLKSCEHTVISDRIVASTYLSAVALTHGKCEIENINPADMVSVIDFFKETGCKITVKKNKIILNASDSLSYSGEIVTCVYPGFPTDAGPIIFPFLSVIKGISVFKENIFENRFRFVDELRRFGADITIKDRIAVIKGGNALHGANVECTDLRGGAALVIAALASEGESNINKIYHIKRGYTDIVSDLKNLGADIKIG